VSDWLTDATAAGVWPLEGGGYTTDGDAYTIAGVTRPPPTGKPVLTSLTPTEFVIGSPSVALHCIGTGFTRDCVIAFAGRAERTDFHNDKDISTFIDSELWTGPDVVKVAVVSQERGGSQTIDFPIVAS
jgi:hypothetical protein